MSQTQSTTTIPPTQFLTTSGNTTSVWTATEPADKVPKFNSLKGDANADVVVVGAGIAGISTAFELLKSNLSVILIDARHILSGETGRTTGHLSTAVDSGYLDITKTFSPSVARHVYDAQFYGMKHIGEISKELGIECEYRHVPYYQMVHVPPSDPAYEKENDLKEEFDACEKIGIPVVWHEKKRMTDLYEGEVLEFPSETHATFHPTKYLTGLLSHMVETYPDKFKCYTETRMESFTPPSSGIIATVTGTSTPTVSVQIENGGKITASHLVETTNVPHRTLPIIIKEHYDRTYAIAIKAPKDSFPDMLLYDNNDPYVYVRKTAHREEGYELVIVGGEDHKVGFEKDGMFDNLLEWTKKHLPQVGTEVEYEWSGQIVTPNDGIPYIGESEPKCHVVTGDSGNGLVYGVAASKILTDIITGNREHNPWVGIFDPSRKPGLRTLPDLAINNAMQQSKYSRWLTADGLVGVGDIEDIAPCSGAVFHGKPSQGFKPIAYYESATGNVCKFSAVCPHLKGIVKWNEVEKSWDCPNHGSRFAGDTGMTIMGPSAHGLAKEE